MELNLKSKPLIGFIISTLVVFGSMNVWVLTVSSPFFLYLVFKMLGVWKTNERIIYGVPAIILGVLLFFLAFSVHIMGTPQGDFRSEDGSIHAIIKPYATDDMSRSFQIEVTYRGVTEESLGYKVEDIFSKRIVERGEVQGEVQGNLTKFSFQINPPKGLYDITLSVGNKSFVISAVKTTTLDLFWIYLKSSGLMISMLLTGLYLLLMYGIHVVRTGGKMGERYA